MLVVFCSVVGTVCQQPMAGSVCGEVGFGKLGPGESPIWNGIPVSQGTLRNNTVMFTPNKHGSTRDASDGACASLVPRDGYFGMRLNTLL